MAAPARKLSKSALRAIAIRRSIARRASTDNVVTANIASNDNEGRKPRRRMSKGLLAACVDAGGFDQNARFA